MSRRTRLEVARLEDRDVPATAIPGIIAVGSGPGTESQVQVYDAQDGSLKFTLDPFPGFTGGLSAAGGDVTGDGVPDIATSTGSGGGPRVVVFNGANLATVASFFAFDPGSRNGFNIAVGDVNADGRADIVTGAGTGEPGQVKVFSGKNLT